MRCLGRLYFVIALLFRRFGCHHMKCALHIFGCYFMKDSVSIDLVVILWKILFP